MNTKDFSKKREKIQIQLDKYNQKYKELEESYLEDKKVINIGQIIQYDDVQQMVDSIYVENNETNDIVYVMTSNVLPPNHGLFYKVIAGSSDGTKQEYTLQLFKQEYFKPTKTLEQIESKNKGKMINDFKVTKTNE